MRATRLRGALARNARLQRSRNGGLRAAFVTTGADFTRPATAYVLNLQHAPTLLPGAVVASGASR
jgi:hypothetical protein